MMNQEQFTRWNRQAATEGIVLLKNEGKMLPVKKEERLAVYGRVQIEYYRSGTGSGGAVNVPYTTSLLDGLEENQIQVDETVKQTYKDWIQEHPFDNGGGGWAAEPWFQEDMPLSETFVKEAAERTDKAFYIIGRTAGEDKDNQKEEGSYYLTAKERENLEIILKYHEHTAVLLNVSNIIDMSWIEEIPGREHMEAIVYLWQGGMEGGVAAGDVLSGAYTPDGRLTDTIARHIEDYSSDANFGNELQNIYEEDIYVGYRYFETFAKESVLFPFGFGLSYTEFETEVSRVERGEESIRFYINVKNIGKEYAGKEVVQIYYEAPQGKLGKPARELFGFVKTGLLKPGEEEEVVIEAPVSSMASYDSNGCTGYPFAYVLEAGAYQFYAGENVRDAKEVPEAAWTVEETILVEQLEEALAPRQAFHILKPGAKLADGTYEKEMVPVDKQTISMKERILSRLPEELEITGDQGITLQQVRDGEKELNDFIAQLSIEELAAIVRGEGMSHPKVTKGTASAFGGVSDSLTAYGVPLACCADGPSGLRMEADSVQLPIGTMLASTWNPDLIQKVYSGVGMLMKEYEVDTLLGPGMNIHRHPLNGRNFEYYSEDPYLTGVCAAAAARGMREHGVTGTIKHFAANGQETYRHRIEAVCSERAMREIYLKGFEIAIKSREVYSIMTSYNPLNGFWAASSYDLNTTILRGEWGYTGMVMTDWWAEMNDAIEGGEESDKRTADMVRAQNDVYMVVNINGAEINSNKDDTLQALEEGRLTVGELQRCAKNICTMILNSPVIERDLKEEEDIEQFIPEEANGREVQNAKTDAGYCVTVGEAERVGFAVEESGVFSIIAEIASGLTNLAQSTSRVSLNGKVMTTIQTKGTEGKWTTQKLQKVMLESGFYELSVEKIQAGLDIKTIEFRKIKK